MPTFSMAQGMMVKLNVVVSGLGVTIGPEYWEEVKPDIEYVT